MPAPSPPSPARTAVEPADPARLRARLLATGLLAPGDRVLVAVSGGADSTALASLLHGVAGDGLPLGLVLAHLDHGWRGRQEAEADRATVQAVAARLGRPLVTAGPPDPPARGEDAARRWRYATLARLAVAQGATHVATGHHLRDQVETFLLRLLRGSGLPGLCGIPERRPLLHGRLCVVRPLLDEHPEALRAWLVRQGLPWREDATNAGPGERNAMRRRLLALEARAPDALRALTALGERLRARLLRQRAAVDARLLDLVERAIPGRAAQVAREALHALRGTSLAWALGRLGASLGAGDDGPWLTRRHVALVEAALAGGGAVDLPRGLTLRVGSRRVWLVRRRGPAAPVALERSDAPRAGGAAVTRDRADPLRVQVDAERLGEEAVLREAQPRDAFVPWGSRSGRLVPVEAWLRKRSVPAAARRRALVVAGANGVAWVVGSRLDARHAVTPETRAVATLSVRWGSPAP